MTFAGVADTHTALWYLYGDDRLSDPARALVGSSEVAGQKIAVSSISLIEVVYLVEKARIPASAYSDVVSTLVDPAHVFVEVAVSAEIADTMRKISRAEVPDMPDRIIAATALYLKVPVISRDERIRSASLETVW